jgi:hypothetical protein
MAKDRADNFAIMRSLDIYVAAVLQTYVRKARLFSQLTLSGIQYVFAVM